MYGNEKVIKIFVWKSNKLNQPNPKVQLKAMENNITGYDPLENARQLSRLFSMSLPGNTLDVFYSQIAKDLMHLMDFNLSYMDRQHVENNIRISINQLAEGENDG